MLRVKPVNLLSLDVPYFDQREKLENTQVSLLEQAFCWSQAVLGVNGVERFNQGAQPRHY
jgi:hypothetical protein